MNARIQRLRVEARDLLELVLLPGLAALLPWNLVFRVLRRIAKRFDPYGKATRAAQAQAAARGWVGDEAHWSMVRKVVTLVDHADLYLGRTRSDDWMAQHLDVRGAWPTPGQAGLLCTFHIGAGMWGLRHARASGMKAHAIVAPLEGAHFVGRRVLLAYARARTAEVARSLGCPTLDMSASLRPVLQALRRGEQVVAAIDVPADQVSASEEISLLGMRARVPRGLLRLAVDQALPVTVYLTGLDVDTGRRVLHIHQLGVHEDLGQLIREVFDFLDQAIREDPPAWHFWGESERIFVHP
ncbi:MAG: hypothetical protein ABIU58_03150 [Ramlibacter sp.]